MSEPVVEWVASICRKAIAPPPAMTVSEWADRYRRLPPTSAEPGPWRTDRVPFLREIMDCMSPSHPCERVAVMKSAQVAMTEALLNTIGHIVHHVPSNILLVLPSTELVRRNTPTRIDPLFEATPVLRDLVVPFGARTPGNTTTWKRFRGGDLIMTGANSAAGLRSLPARFVLKDEVDGFPADADGEGDPSDLADRAAITFVGRRKIVEVSTPTVQGISRIERSFLAGDQRRYFVPCPHCAEWFVPDWQQVAWPEDRPELAHLTCPHCGTAIEEHERAGMIGRGEWRATAKGDGKTVSFHVGGLLSPWQSVAELAVQYMLVRKDPLRLQTFKNLRLGELWTQEVGAAPAVAACLERREDWGDRLPAGVVAITAGIDTQDDRLELEIIGWGRDFESWSLDHVVLWGSPGAPEVWMALDQELRRTFEHARQLPALPIKAACIDFGGHFGQAVADFAAQRAARRIFAIKGRAGPGVPIWPRRPSETRKGRQPIYLVGIDAAKEAIYARLAIEEPGPGYSHFPLDRHAEWFEQLTSERLLTRYVGGRPSRLWSLASGSRNEALDCRVYGLAALHALAALGFRLNREADVVEAIPLRDQMVPAASSVPAVKRTSPTVIPSPWMQGFN